MADVVLGQTNFTTVSPIPVSEDALTPAQNTMLDPVSVSSDGVRLFVADLGYNRVLIWNSIPTKNMQQADIELGQKDFVTAISERRCRSLSSGGNRQQRKSPISRTLRQVDGFSAFRLLSDGTRLYVADGGNDRVLILQHSSDAKRHETRQRAGPSPTNTRAWSAAPPLCSCRCKSVRFRHHAQLPGRHLHVDGTNLYVADPSNRRILVFTPEESTVPINGVRNGASLQAYATGGVDIGGTIQAGDTVTITIMLARQITPTRSSQPTRSLPSFKPW